LSFLSVVLGFVENHLIKKIHLDLNEKLLGVVFF